MSKNEKYSSQEEGTLSPGASLSLGLKPERYSELSGEDAKEKSWEYDFGYPIRNKEQLTEQLRQHMENLGWDSFTEFFTAIALRALFPRYGRVSNSVEYIMHLGVSSDPLGHVKGMWEQRLTHNPSLNREELIGKYQLYHGFVKALMEEWRQAGLLK